MQVRKRAVHPLDSAQSFVTSGCLLTAPAPPGDGSSYRAVPDVLSVVRHVCPSLGSTSYSFRTHHRECFSDRGNFCTSHILSELMKSCLYLESLLIHGWKEVGGWGALGS